MWGNFLQMKVYNFDAEIAAEYGVDNAIMIWNLQYWIEHNEANGKHFYDGRTWTFNSVDAFSKIFSFWSKGQIRRILNSLIEKGVILTGNYNSSAYDRTTWYAFTDSFLQMHFPKSKNGETETARCINDGNINPSIDIYNKNQDNKNDAAESGLFPSEQAEIITRPRRTSENLCLFENSRFYNYETFAKEFTAPEFAGVDILYYYHAVADWSAQGGKKKRDWIATARNFMRGDMENGKLHRLPGQQQPAAKPILDEATIEYLKMCNE